MPKSISVAISGNQSTFGHLLDEAHPPVPPDFSAAAVYYGFQKSIFPLGGPTCRANLGGPGADFWAEKKISYLNLYIPDPMSLLTSRTEGGQKFRFGPPGLLGVKRCWAPHTGRRAQIAPKKKFHI
jgi:hypothetical protein